MSVLAFTLLATLAPAQDAGVAPEARLARRQTLRISGPLAAWRVLDLDGDGSAEILTIDRAGRLAVRSAGSKGTYPETVEGGLGLSAPDRTLLGLKTAADGKGRDLVVVDPEGARVHRLTDGAFEPTGELLAARARNTLRTGAPIFCDVVQDVNGDGREDLVVPAGRGVDLWMEREVGEGEPPSFRRTASVPVRVLHVQSSDAELLSDTLVEILRIPRLSTEDVNGDGREDLVVVDEQHRAYHLQREDGAFPREPDRVLDLSIFRDTTPEAALAPGRTLVLSDEASVQSSDLDSDGIPDYVIAHRRKVWVFHGTAQGPQFLEPSSILKTAEDVTGLSLIKLDDDEFVDLLIYKLDVPSIGALVVGMFQSWDIEITVLGYSSLQGARFGTTAAKEGKVVLRLPPLLDILKRPEDLLGKLEEAERKFRAAASGDFDGDGLEDVMLIGEEAKLLEVWRTPSVEHLTKAEESDDAWIRRLLFEQEDPVFGLERVLEYLTAFGERRTRRLTGDRGADASLPLGEGTGLPLVAAIPADVDGDGSEELVLAYESIDGRVAFEIVELDIQ